MMYLPLKEQVLSIVKHHFPPVVSDRFSVRMDSEIYIPKEDEGVFMRHKYGHENIHVLFDNMEIFEFPERLERKYVELMILKSFKLAIEQGTVSIDVAPEYTDNATARRNKREKDSKKKKKIEESYKFAQDNNFNLEQIEAKLPGAGKSKKTQKKKIIKLTN